MPDLRNLTRSWRVAALAATCALGAAPMPQDSDFDFVDVSTEVGLDFIHIRGETGEKHLPETMGSGVAWLDFDGDGDLDLYLVQSGPLPGTAAPRPANQLWRNSGGKLENATGRGAEDDGYGMGAVAADWDGDGFIDLFVSNYGSDRLYRNNGDGTYSPVPDAGVEDGRWSASAAWSDLDQDGLADLYVTKYVVYDVATALPCGEQQYDKRSYCHIDLFRAEADTVYRNRGDGTFEDLSETAGVTNTIEGKGLGVVIGDVNDDHLDDIYVANDTQQNFLYLNQGDWTFEEQGLFSGTGYSESGTGMAGMGTAMQDLDGDGRAEILVTNFAFENNNLYREIAPGAYLDDSSALGFGAPGFATLAFGIVAFDADADGDLEILVANGHILDNVTEVQDNTTYPQRNHLFENHLIERRREAVAAGQLEPGGAAWRPETDLFSEVSAASGAGLALVEVTRGLATGDLDGDGLPEVALTNSAGAARILANRSPAVGNRVVVRLRGRGSNRDAIGALARLVPIRDSAEDGVAGFAQTAEVRAGSSYLSQNATDLYFGIGEAERARLAVRWPDGREEVVGVVNAGELVLVVEGQSHVRRPLGPRRP